AAGAVTDSYHYDAFGNLLNSNGGTANSYLYTGEQFDAGLNQYYLRARYYDQNVGRFSAMDSFLGWEEDPTTLHKYIYANVDPVNGTDPSGYFTLGGVMSGVNISSGLSTASTAAGFSALSRVIATLVVAGAGLSLSDDIKEFIARNAPAMNRLLEDKRAREKARVETRSRARRPLFHYTDRMSGALIGATGTGFVTPTFRGLGTNGNTRPAGFYATDI